MTATQPPLRLRGVISSLGHLLPILLVFALSTNISGDIPAEISARVQHLRQQIRHHDYLYYVKNAPQISDTAYDRLFQELVALEKAHPGLITPDSPTQRLSPAYLEGDLTKVPHSSPVLSLNKAYSLDDLRTFDENIRAELQANIITYSLEPKLDGVSVILRYSNGKLKQALTRGDGETGQDITAAVRTIRNLPLRLHTKQPPSFYEIRGEIVISLNQFKNLNRKRRQAGEAPFVTPRAAVTGTLMLNDLNEVNRRKLDICVFDFRHCSAPAALNQHNFLTHMRNLGFKTPQYAQQCHGIASLERAVKQWLTAPPSLPYACDGLVIKVDSFKQQKQLGQGSRSPHWAIAYKFPSATQITRLTHVDWQIGRTGRLTPVAHFNPVTISNTTLTQASLHSLKSIRDKKLKIGDWVQIKKAGGTIPAVVRSFPKRRTGNEQVIQPPNNCPQCRHPLGATTKSTPHCSNAACPGRLKAALVYFASRDVMDIDGLGPDLCAALVDTGLVQEPLNLYSMDKRAWDNLSRQPNLDKTTILHLHDAIQHSRDRASWRLLTGLGIPGVGPTTARMLMNHFGSIGAIGIADKKQLATIKGIGPTTAAGIIAWFESHDIEPLK